ncbi:CAF17-like 4Fe-4S cluster assembly/insertion protein YgfZ [Candidatus Hepatobacter penaei]|uniref:CAF17-like 4Fe-4S cluster assembly/insertion protein YgfZ n=1 Tax=Candidatus Hepatobacter penaei TaxID=1274402 RepID=UPI0004F327FF|nr:folate-binding protein YgfZ [Candidatus Hepatobacter penaei]
MTPQTHSAPPMMAVLDRHLISIHGPDTHTFLQALITQDMSLLRTQKAVYSLLLSPQGRFLFDFFLINHHEGLLLDVACTRLDELLHTLKRYCLRSRVTFEDVSSSYDVVALFSPHPFGSCVGGSELSSFPAAVTPPQDGLCFGDPRLPALGVRMVAPKGWQSAAGEHASKNGPLVSQATYQRHQLSLGVADTSSMEPGKAIPLEYGLHHLYGIAEQKGCYLGQELIARTLHRGQIHKSVFPALCEKGQPQRGQSVVCGAGEAAASVIDVHQDIALIRGPVLRLNEIVKHEGRLFFDRDAGKGVLTPAISAWMQKP